MTYRPLPDYLTIKESEIEGLGLFTNEVIVDEIEIGTTHYKVDEELIRTPLGGFINHSDYPNCELVKTNDKYYLKTIRDIMAGEELTLEYTLYKIKTND
jgi:hypothetical protein